MKRVIARFTPYDDLSSWLRGLAVSAAFAFFMALSGAFGTGDAPPALRAIFWGGVMFLGYLWGGYVARRFFRDGRQGPARPWMYAILVATIMAGPFTLVVWSGSRLILRSDIPLRGLPVLFLYVFVVALVVTSLYWLIEGRRAPAALAAPPPPKFLERLPLKLRGAEVWAVEAEDHYLRLHTSKGQDLILMRLADAVAELDGIEGRQVHRSWWVARDAIVDARRGDGRATLTLKDGAQVPVSRTYAGELRDRGWI